jgi:hypothetical protein
VVEAAVLEAFPAQQAGVHGAAGAADFHIDDGVALALHENVPVAADDVVDAIGLGELMKREILAFIQQTNPVGMMEEDELGVSITMSLEVLFEKLELVGGQLAADAGVEDGEVSVLVVEAVNGFPLGFLLVEVAGEV